MAGEWSTRALVLLAGLTIAAGSAFADLRPAINRPDLLEIGEPTLISRATLKKEMERNSDLKEHIESYGWPDYAEIQRTQVEEPLEDYEVRLYYLSRERELAFVHVYIAPAMKDYGIKRYDGPIPDETLARILTAKMNEPEPLPPPVPAAEPAAPAEAPAAPLEAPNDGGGAAPAPGAELSAPVPEEQAAADEAVADPAAAPAAEAPQ